MKYKAYICSTDAQYHIPDDWDGIQIYFSEKSLRAHKTCVCDKAEHGCFPVEIEIKLPKVIKCKKK